MGAGGKVGVPRFNEKIKQDPGWDGKEKGRVGGHSPLPSCPCPLRKGPPRTNPLQFAMASFLIKILTWNHG